MSDQTQVATAVSVPHADAVAGEGMRLGKRPETASQIPHGRLVLTSRITGIVEVRYAPLKPKQQGVVDTAL